MILRGNVVMVVTPTDTTRYEYDYRKPADQRGGWDQPHRVCV